MCVYIRARKTHFGIRPPRSHEGPGVGGSPSGSVAEPEEGAREVRPLAVPRCSV